MFYLGLDERYVEGWPERIGEDDPDEEDFCSLTGVVRHVLTRSRPPPEDMDRRIVHAALRDPVGSFVAIGYLG
jgi:hypothetical protein